MKRVPRPNEIPLSEMVAIMLVTRLAVLPFFPSEDGARAAIVDLLMAICETEEQAGWLIRRMTSGIYPKWPGPTELRACYCQRWKPKDGLSVSSNYFEGDWPIDPEAPRALPPGSLFMLESTSKGRGQGHGQIISSADAKELAEFEAEWKELQARQRLPPPPPRDARPEQAPQRDRQSITQADIDKAVEELHRRK